MCPWYQHPQIWNQRNTRLDFAFSVTRCRTAPDYLYQHVECLWQLDTLPFRSEKNDNSHVTSAVNLLENLKLNEPPDLKQCKVLLFSTTSSLRCATIALQNHLKDYAAGNEDTQAVEESFYAGNCLRSLPTAEAAKCLVDKMRNLLATGGFEIHQWISNEYGCFSPPGLSQIQNLERHSDPQEPALGLSWHCLVERLGYKIRPLETTSMIY